MAITNMSQLQNALMKKCYELVNEEKRYALKIFEKYIDKFYEEYDPGWYKRTYQLFSSLASTKITKTANGYKTEIYFKVSRLKYFETKAVYNERGDVERYDFVRWNTPQENREIFEYAAYGQYYGYNPHGDWYVSDADTTIWKDPVTDIQIQMRPQLKRYLQSKGIKVK